MQKNVRDEMTCNKPFGGEKRVSKQLDISFSLPLSLQYFRNLITLEVTETTGFVAVQLVSANWVSTFFQSCQRVL